MIEVILKHGEPNQTKKSCYNCNHCKGAVSWWCTNKEAIEARGTKIPGTTNCPFWKGVRIKKDLNWFERIFGDFIYISPTTQCTLTRAQMTNNLTILNEYLSEAVEEENCEEAAEIRDRIKDIEAIRNETK